MIDVSIIFVNYNTIAYLLEAIDSVYAKTKSLSFEIIVVDNNSIDNSESTIIEKYGDKINYIKLPENIGFGRANNEGFKVARGRYFYCLNPDTLLLNNSIKYLVDYLDSNNNTAVVGSQLYNVDGTLQKSYSTFFMSISSNLSDLLFLSNFRKDIFYSSPTNVASVYGASMMLRSDVIDLVKGFNPQFFMYAEEEDLCYRISQLKYNITFIPDSKVLHLDGGSFQFSKNRELRRIEGEKNFYKSNYSTFYVGIVYLIKILICINRILIFMLLFNFDKLRYWYFRLKNTI